MNRIDYDLIVNELSKGLKTNEDPVVVACGIWKTKDGVHTFCGHDAYYFKEYRTIGLHVPRQMGKTRWIASKIADTGSALSIVRDETYVRFFEQFFQDYAQHVRDDAMSRVLPIAEVKRRIAKGTLEKYDTYYIDEARHSFHFFENELLRYFIDTAQWLPTIVLVG